MKSNKDVRKVIYRSNLYYWQVAQALGITDSNFSRLLRNELSLEKKEEILTIIRKIKGEELEK